MKNETEEKYAIELKKEELEILKNSINFACKSIKETLEGSVEAVEAMCKLKVVERLEGFEKKLDTLCFESKVGCFLTKKPLDEYDNPQDIIREYKEKISTLLDEDKVLVLLRAFDYACEAVANFNAWISETRYEDAKRRLLNNAIIDVMGEEK